MAQVTAMANPLPFCVQKWDATQPPIGSGSYWPIGLTYEQMFQLYWSVKTIGFNGEVVDGFAQYNAEHPDDPATELNLVCYPGSEFHYYLNTSEFGVISLLISFFEPFLYEDQYYPYIYIYKLADSGEVGAISNIYTGPFYGTIDFMGFGNIDFYQYWAAEFPEYQYTGPLPTDVTIDSTWDYNP